MKLSDIKNTFEGKMSWTELKKKNFDEMEEYRTSLKTKGGSVPIYVVEDIEQLIVDKRDLKKILEAILDNSLNDLAVSYITDALTLSGNVVFESEDIREDIESLTDPEINGRLNEEIIKAMLKRV